MKVGILTFHQANNYGAVLQCYALMSFLKDKGVDANVLDYCPDFLKKERNNVWSSIGKKIKAYLRFFLCWFFSKGEVEHIDGFDFFRKNAISPVPMSMAEQMDAVVCGSDQIWNTKICGELDPVFFALPFHHCRKISYAASNGSVALSDEEKRQFVCSLKNFDHISVREVSLQQQLSDLGINSEIVLDPVLLAGSQSFEEIVTPIRQKRPYVLIYELTHLDRTYELAHLIARQLKADLVVIGGGVKAYLKCGFINKQGLTPAQFVSYFKHAACVVTTSFHGTAFSLVYERPFYSMKMNMNKDDRILSLLSSLDLMSRSVGDLFGFVYSEVDYVEVNYKLNVLRGKSANFLVEALYK